MHELSIARSLVRVAEEGVASCTGDVRITRLYLTLGPLAGVVRESLEFAYDFATAGTLLEGSTLVIEPVDIVVRCDDCHHQGAPISKTLLRCTECHQPTPNILHGRELVVRAIDYDDLPSSVATPSSTASPQGDSGSLVPAHVASGQPDPTT